MLRTFHTLAIVCGGLAWACGARTPLGDDHPIEPGNATDTSGAGGTSGSSTGISGSSASATSSSSTGVTASGTGTTGVGTGTSGTTGVGGNSGTSASSAATTGPTTTGTTSGAGGSFPATGGAGGASGSKCQPVFAPGEELIDDMNDGDAFIPSVNGRAGSWTQAHDYTMGVSIFPPDNAPFQMTPNGPPCGGFAARLYGGPFTVWGASFGFGVGAPYDASAYSGFSFTAHTGAGPLVINVQFPDKDTDPAGGICDPSTNGPNYCFDHFSYPIMLNPVWTKHVVTFAQLRQGGWGRVVKAFDPTSLRSINFLIPTGAKFDVWVDNVAFVKR